MTAGLIGVDEVGRGAFAGPIVVCGLIAGAEFPAVHDSKKYSAKAREQLYGPVLAHTMGFSIRMGDSAAIDRIGLNFVWNNLVAEVIEDLRKRFGDVHAVVDGDFLPAGIRNAEAMIKADEILPEVGGASILAKVKRDQVMKELALLWPGYGWERNAGYGSQEHQESILAKGVTPVHRRSFLRNLLGTDEGAEQSHEGFIHLWESGVARF